MRFFCLFFLLAFYSGLSAQPSFKKGQQIHISNISSSEIDLGMGLLMINNNQSESVLEVKEEKENAFLVSSKLTKAKVTSEMMGQSTSYDSENPADKDSEAGKILAPYLNTTVVYIVNKITGKATRETPDSSIGSGPMAPVMEMFGDQGGKLISEAYLTVDKKQAKQGTWTITDSTSEAKTVTTYTIESIKGNEAVIKFESNTTISTIMDQDGTQVTLNMASKSKGVLSSDIKTSLVKKRTTDTEINGSFEMMGQSSEITGKVNSVTSYTTK